MYRNEEGLNTWTSVDPLLAAQNESGSDSLSWCQLLAVPAGTSSWKEIAELPGLKGVEVYHAVCRRRTCVDAGDLCTVLHITEASLCAFIRSKTLSQALARSLLQNRILVSRTTETSAQPALHINLKNE